MIEKVKIDFIWSTTEDKSLKICGISVNTSLDTPARKPLNRQDL
jgi:hypothetical protein